VKEKEREKEPERSIEQSRPQFHVPFHLRDSFFSAFSNFFSRSPFFNGFPISTPPQFREYTIDEKKKDERRRKKKEEKEERGSPKTNERKVFRMKIPILGGSSSEEDEDKNGEEEEEKEKKNRSLSRSFNQIEELRHLESSEEIVDEAYNKRRRKPSLSRSDPTTPVKAARKTLHHPKYETPISEKMEVIDLEEVEPALPPPPPLPNPKTVAPPSINPLSELRRIHEDRYQAHKLQEKEANKQVKEVDWQSLISDSEKISAEEKDFSRRHPKFEEEGDFQEAIQRSLHDGDGRRTEKETKVNDMEKEGERVPTTEKPPSSSLSQSRSIILSDIPSFSSSSSSSSSLPSSSPYPKRVRKIESPNMELLEEGGNDFEVKTLIADIKSIRSEDKPLGNVESYSSSFPFLHHFPFSPFFPSTSC